MEIHAHTHSPRKKWSHYFWEFLMLFLAVFAGFLAENQREKLVEHHREKQFMVSLIEDLSTDTTELHSARSRADRAALHSDSALMFLAKYRPSETLPYKAVGHMAIAGIRLTLINTDRTSSQLKNSGGMRLIRNKKVSDDILQYWKQIEETNIMLERYLIYRNSLRDLGFRLFLLPQVYQTGLGISSDSLQNLKVIDTDPKKWGELTNLYAITGQILRQGYQPNLDKQLDLARELIALIKQEYHLKQ